MTLASWSKYVEETKNWLNDVESAFDDCYSEKI